MKKLLLIAAIFVSTLAYAQKQDYVFVIKGYDTVYEQEFMSNFEPNGVNTQNTAESLDEYLNLYINYKLKLLDAKSMGLQNDSNIIEQINKYRSEITRPYINNPKVMDSLAKDAYDKQRLLLRVQHILISVPKNVAPDDTLQYYNKAMDIYSRLRKGESFDVLASKYSDDPSTQSTAKYPNAGDLGYFSSMTMVYPFEKACYDMLERKDTLAMGQTAFGYHIIKFIDTISTQNYSYALRHIYIDKDKHSPSEAQRLINQAYEDIKTIGVDSTAKKYSDDVYTKPKGGMLVNQRANALPAQYVQKMEKMHKGDISEPFQTRFGWHIIQFLDAAPIMPFQQQRSMIMDRISKDERAYISLEKFVSQSKIDYNYNMDSSALKAVYKMVDDSVFSATWFLPEEKVNKPLFNLSYNNDTQFYNQKDFLNYIYEHQTKQVPIDLKMYVNRMYDAYSKEQITKYADKHLEKKYPQIQSSLDKFKEGELIFAITNMRVWNKSLTDTLGLEDFYQKNKSKYMYTPRADAVIWSIDTNLNLKKINKQILSYKKKNKTDDWIREKLNNKYTSKADTTHTGKKKVKVNFSWNRFEKGTNNIIDKNIFGGQISLESIKTPITFVDTNSITNRNIIVYLNQMMPISQKPLSACKGLCTSDYQDYLEAQWIESLHKQYAVEINRQEVNKLKQQIK